MGVPPPSFCSSALAEAATFGPPEVSLEMGFGDIERNDVLGDALAGLGRGEAEKDLWLVGGEAGEGPGSGLEDRSTLRGSVLEGSPRYRAAIPPELSCEFGGRNFSGAKTPGSPGALLGESSNSFFSGPSCDLFSAVSFFSVSVVGLAWWLPARGGTLGGSRLFLANATVPSAGRTSSGGRDVGSAGALEDSVAVLLEVSVVVTVAVE